MRGPGGPGCQPQHPLVHWMTSPPLGKGSMTRDAFRHYLPGAH